jgi:hypothetical protein|tara:strand:+ start:1089 stop:1397 length:309 start_codon:yes stop_codon:yes gene_type:complete
MSKLLETQLPLATGDEVTPDIYNRLVRILELNLGAIDISISPHFTQNQVDSLQFATGAIIFNSTTEVHQAFDGKTMRNLYEHQTTLSSFSVTSALGSISVTV